MRRNRRVSWSLVLAVTGLLALGGPGTRGSATAEECGPGGQWVLAASNGPSPRGYYSMAYDSVRGVMVLFGGIRPGPIDLGDTWEWNGVEWILRCETGPSARGAHDMAFDPIRRKTYLFGGSSWLGRPLDDFWEWDGGGWKQIPRSGLWPPAMGTQTMLFHPGIGKVVLFGGAFASPLGQRSDTLWAWDGTNWEILQTGGIPARSHHSMTYDEERNVLIVFGGEGNGVNWPPNYNDTWEWDIHGWRQIDAGVDPVRNEFRGICYFPPTRQTFLFGGNPPGLPLGISDHWVWDGSIWTRIFFAVMPPPRSWHKLVYDEARREIVMFGGASDPEFLGDTWVFRATNRPPEADAGGPYREDCAGLQGTPVELDGTASRDPDGGRLTYFWSAPGVSFDDPTSPRPVGIFPLGVTEVTLVVSDGIDEDVDVTQVEVADLSRPVLESVTVTPGCLWPPNHKFVLVTIRTRATDLADPAPGMVVRVESSEPEDGLGDGDTSPDILPAEMAGAGVVGEGDVMTIQLRAERFGNGAGRVYTVSVCARDSSGHLSEPPLVAKVRVEHDQGQGELTITRTRPGSDSPAPPAPAPHAPASSNPPAPAPQGPPAPAAAIGGNGAPAAVGGAGGNAAGAVGAGGQQPDAVGGGSPGKSGSAGTPPDQDDGDSAAPPAKEKGGGASDLDSGKLGSGAGATNSGQKIADKKKSGDGPSGGVDPAGLSK